MELLLLELFRITLHTFYMEIWSHYAYEFACMNEYFKCFCYVYSLSYFSSMHTIIIYSYFRYCRGEELQTWHELFSILVCCV